MRERPGRSTAPRLAGAVRSAACPGAALPRLAAVVLPAAWHAARQPLCSRRRLEVPWWKSVLWYFRRSRLRPHPAAHVQLCDAYYSRGKRDPASPPVEGSLFVVHSRWRTVKRQELQKRKGREKEKETSELAKASGSADSKSCGGCQLPPFHRGCPFFCRESTRQMERFRSGLQVQGFPRKHQQPCN
ncbi:uncharacterized protein ACIBXB_021005 [Morphnus guianensis]